MKARFLIFCRMLTATAQYNVFRVGYIQHCATSNCNCN